MEKENLLVNVLPSPTYNWLKMNEAKVQVPEVLKEGNPIVERPVCIAASAVSYQEMQDIAGGMGYDMDKLVRDAGVDVLKLHAGEGVKASRPVQVRFAYQQEDNLLNAVLIEAEDNSELTVVMDFYAPEDAHGFAGVQTKIRLGKNAVVRLIQVQRLGQGFRFFNDIGSVTAEGASFEQIELIQSGTETYHGSRTDLLGAHSSLKTDIAYLLKNDDHLDMNYIANHIGRKTNCSINVNGVLRDTSSKLFRGTIDLRKGAKGAVGNEMEDVLLMDDHVVNQTIPVILCDEEDVEGNHGATIGRIDEGLLFYLESRGMSRNEVYEMMAEARIDAVINQISDAETRETVYKHLTGHGAVKFAD